MDAVDSRLRWDKALIFDFIVTESMREAFDRNDATQQRVKKMTYSRDTRAISVNREMPKISSVRMTDMPLLENRREEGGEGGQRKGGTPPALSPRHGVFEGVSGYLRVYLGV